MREALMGPVNRTLGWLQARERQVLLVTVAAQLLILVGMIALRALPLITGQTVLVRVEPVDPRDLFRGDYVILSYPFSRVPPDQIGALSGEQLSSKKLEGRTVYVPLVPDSNGVHMRGGTVTLEKPASGLFIKGHMKRYGSMEFGIESYFVEEGTGRRYERAIRDRHLSAELAVTSGGQAALKSLGIE